MYIRRKISFNVIECTIFLSIVQKRKEVDHNMIMLHFIITPYFLIVCQIFFLALFVHSFIGCVTNRLDDRKRLVHFIESCQPVGFLGKKQYREENVKHYAIATAYRTSKINENGNGMVYDHFNFVNSSYSVFSLSFYYLRINRNQNKILSIRGEEKHLLSIRNAMIVFIHF